MGNTDSIPVISQAKSLTQYAFGNATAARQTQNNFLYDNRFPVLSQLGSLGYSIAGDNDKALDLQKKFADDMVRIIDTIPVAGHIKGGVHYALGDHDAGDEAMKAASRSTGVVAGGVGGFMVGGPVGAVAGGIAGGAAVDGAITGSEILLKKDEAKPYGYVAVGKEIGDAVNSGQQITVERGFDMAMLPVGDGVGGYVAGKVVVGKPLALDVVGGGGKKIVRKFGYRPLISEADGPVVKIGNSNNVAAKVKVVAINEADDAVIPHNNNGNYLGLDKKKALDNRANQLNPNHPQSGPGRPAGYQGQGTVADLNNHANQLNPNNPVYGTG